MNNPLTAIPALYRKYLYTVYFTVGVVFGALQLAYANLGDPAHAMTPAWLRVALVVYAYVGTVLGLTAATNVGPQDVPPPAPEPPVPPVAPPVV